MSDEFLSWLDDPAFALRAADRLGTRAVSYLLTQRAPARASTDARGDVEVSPEELAARRRMLLRVAGVR
jgi:hypothetical protein